jgi:hypothetical protein
MVKKQSGGKSGNRSKMANMVLAVGCWLLVYAPAANLFQRD